MTSSISPTPDPHVAFERIGVRVSGVVQGVGFRPFVYRLATEEHLAGFIGNDTDGVTIEIEGTPLRIRAFLARLRSETPPLSRIDSVITRNMPPTGETGFRIIASEVHGRVTTGIPADAATCPDCLRELLSIPPTAAIVIHFSIAPTAARATPSPAESPTTVRRPRWPAFKMCPACQAEYDDPLNRRFHAQPNACWLCGPHVWLESPEDMPIESPDPVAETIERLLRGEILAIKGIGGFHLSVDATSEQAVSRLRQRKHRYGKPLAIMVRDLDGGPSNSAISPRKKNACSHSRTPHRAGAGSTPIMP